MLEILIDISALWLRAFLIVTIILVALALVFMSYKQTMQEKSYGKNNGNLYP